MHRHTSATILLKRIKSVNIFFMLLLILTFLTSCATLKAGQWYKNYGIAEYAELRDPSSVPKLINALNDESPRIRLLALDYLYKFGPDAKEAGPAIEKTLFDSHPNIRIKSMHSLERIQHTDESVLDKIATIISNDPHPGVVDAANKTLKRMKFKKLGQVNNADFKLIVSKPKYFGLSKKGVRLVPNFYSIPRPNDVAVVIGIENYQNLSQQSDYSYNDAKLVKEYIMALGFQERNIDFLTNERATGSSIRKSIEAWLPNHIKQDSKVFVYYSGHGAPDANGKGYIVPYDGDPSYLAVTGYSLDRLYASLDKLHASEVIVVMDSCFSGAGARSVIAEGTRPMSIEVNNPILLSDKIAILSSSSMTQISTSYPEKELGLLTYHFLKALKNGKMTLSDIYEYIKPMVEDEAKKMNIEQSPQLLPETLLSDTDFSLR